MKSNLAVGLIMFGLLSFSFLFFGADSFAATATKSATATVTIPETCIFERTSGNGNYSITKDVNELDTTISSTFKVTCNNSSGFKTTGTFSSFTGTGQAITYSTTTPTAGSGTWTATKGNASDTTNMVSGEEGNLMSANSVTSSSGITQKVTYKISTRNNQAAGAYTATAVYRTVQNP